MITRGDLTLSGKWHRAVSFWGLEIVFQVFIIIIIIIISLNI